MLWHRLALEMGSTVSDLKKKMSLPEFASWVAFDKIRPVGGDRVDILLAQIHTTLRTTAGIQNCSLFDSAWWLDDRTEEQAEKERQEKLQEDFNTWVKIHNKRVLENGNDSIT